MPRSCNYFSQKDEYQHRAHNKNLLYVHLIFSIKYRKSLLFGKFDSDIKQWIYNICKRNHWYIQRMELDKNHLHILLQYNPTDSICKIVRKLKQMTTFYAWKKYPTFLKNHFWKEHTLWSDGYFACSVGNACKETIERYIANQG